MAKAEKDGARARDAKGRFLPVAGERDLAISIIHKGKHAGRMQVRKRRCTGWTDAKRDEFLSELAEVANVARALEAVKMHRSGLAKLKQREPDFEIRVESAIEEAFARLELAMLERGRFGVEQPVFQGGKEVGKRIEYPDKMAIHLLRMHKETAASVRARRVDPAVAEADRDAVFIALRARIELMKARRTCRPDPTA